MKTIILKTQRYSLHTLQTRYHAVKNIETVIL